ncbi:MAG: 3-keto-disaccharide hydrolase, partial [Gemmataceae bacterium]
NIAVREIPSSEANILLGKNSGEGYKPLFNTMNFDGWKGATENYEIVNGALRCKPGKGGELYTAAEYDDFELALEFKVPKNGNNGIGIRYPGNGDGAYTGMCELQVLDDNYKEIDPRQAHGSAYGMAAAERGYQRPLGEWNFQTVTVKGSTIVVELNGSRILDTDLSKITDYLGGKPHPGKDRKTGHIGFLGHGDAVEFQNVWVRPFTK